MANLKVSYSFTSLQFIVLIIFIIVTSTIIVDWKVRTNRGEIRFREKSDCYHEDGGLTFCLPRNLHETIPASVMSQYPKDCSKILPLTTPVTEGQHISVSASVFLMDGQTT